MSLRKFKQYIYLMEVDTNENGKMDLTFFTFLPVKNLSQNNITYFLFH